MLVWLAFLSFVKSKYMVNVRVQALLFCGNYPLYNVSTVLFSGGRQVHATSENYGNEILVISKNIYQFSAISLQLYHHCDGAGPNPNCDRVDLIELGYRNTYGYLVAHLGPINLIRPAILTERISSRLKATIKEHKSCLCYYKGHFDTLLKSCNIRR
uniref:Uncharacterized protein n=1 Tax=Parascaris univalens TaxID=6257 RepID=A0A914ZMU8_PARUN